MLLDDPYHNTHAKEQMFKQARSLIAVGLTTLLVGCSYWQKHPVTSQLPEQGIVSGSDCSLCATIDDTVYFDFETAHLRPDGQATLERQANWLAKYPRVKIKITGNCDDRGTEEYNLALGFRRAGASRNFLVAKVVSSDRILVATYGKERPVAPGDNEQAWAKNRNTITAIR